MDTGKITVPPSIAVPGAFGMASMALAFAAGPEAFPVFLAFLKARGIEEVRPGVLLIMTHLAASTISSMSAAGWGTLDGESGAGND